MRERLTGVNPKILTWARERSGLTVAAVADAFRQDATVIQSWESGEAGPSYAQLEKLAYQLYKRPVAVFFFPEPPAEVDPEQAFRTLPESVAGELAPDTRHKIREARAYQLASADLAHGVNPAPRHILREQSLSLGEDAAAAAARIRDYLGITTKTQRLEWRTTEDALRGWRHGVEEVGILVFKDSFKQRDVSGFALFDLAFPVIMINNSTAVTRQIFTLFHELAHLLLGENGVTTTDLMTESKSEDAVRRIEIFCNRFAAELLLPSPDLRQVVQRDGLTDGMVAETSRQFKVSRETVTRRLMDMGLVSQEAYLERADQWNAEFQAVRKETSGGNYYNTQATYLSDTYANLAFGNYYRGSITEEQLADYLNVKTSSLSGLEQAVLRKRAA